MFLAKTTAQKVKKIGADLGDQVIRFIILLNAMLLIISVSASAASEITRAVPDEKRIFYFQAEIQKFLDWEKENSLPREAVLFVGSSTINLWPTATSFPKKAVINRGFGGARTPEVLFFYDKIIRKHNPAAIVVYVGTNDIQAGASPETVVHDTKILLQKMRLDFPTAKLLYMSINPSFLRWHLRSKSGAVNDKIKAYAKSDPSITFLDTNSALIGSDGKPNPAYYALDGLHLNKKGYEILTEAVRPYL